MKTTKQLKTIRTWCGDYEQVLERFAVIKNGTRIGTVHKFTGHSGPAFYDPLRGTGGLRGDGKLVTFRGHIKRRYSFYVAVNSI